MYLKKYDQLTTDQISSIEDEICKGSSNFKELSLKYGVFENVISRIAKDMGIDIDEKDSYNEIVSMALSNGTKVETKGNKKYEIKTKKRVYLTNQQKVAIREEYEKKKDERGIKSRLSEKYGVSFNSITRAIEEVSKKEEETKEALESKKELFDLVDKAIQNVDAPKKEETVKEPVPNISLLSKFVNIKTLTARLDSTNVGNSEPIFNGDLNKIKPNYDFETDVINWFDKYVIGKKINVLEVLYKVSGNDMYVNLYLAKHCMKNKINLTYVMPGGIKKTPAITEFGEESSNLQKIIATSQEATKYIYKTPFILLQMSTTIYTLHLIYIGSKAIYLADTPAKIYELMADLCLKHDDSAYKILVYKMTNGVQEQLIELKSNSWSENKK